MGMLIRYLVLVEERRKDLPQVSAIGDNWSKIMFLYVLYCGYNILDNV